MQELLGPQTAVQKRVTPLLLKQFSWLFRKLRTVYSQRVGAASRVMDSADPALLCLPARRGHPRLWVRMGRLLGPGHDVPSHSMSPGLLSCVLPWDSARKGGP